MKVLVTGGAGFIGASLSKELSNYQEVYIIDNLSTGKKENVPKETVFFKGDITNYDAFKKIPKVDAVFHLAAQTSVPFSMTNPIKDAETNIIGTINLVNWCKNNNIEKIIYSSSAAIYGEPVSLPIDEKHIKNPISPYGISKLCAEKYVSLIPNSIILRYSNVYGPNCEKGEPGVIPLFISKIKNGEPLKIFGDGDQTRDFIHVYDVVKANKMFLEYDGKNKIFNVGRGVETSISYLTKILKEYNQDIKVDYLPERKGDVYRSYFDVSLIKKTGYKTEYDLEKGLKELLK